ncbi:chemosensory receptor A [Elysia marginata]|uniref:Chemosensory receptor A n=1 Tax=Elysia marginata TaxID=1093978 RepID=A0AAV4JBQ5_9GAST|nr:chemosensory receptor A [Elysia marginata]
MIIIFIITIGPYFFIYGNYRIGWYYYADVNRTLLGAPYHDGEVNNIVDRIVFSVLGTLLPQFSFVSTCICTVYLVIHLRKASKFRKSHTRAPTAHGETSNDDGEKTPATTEISTSRDLQKSVLAGPSSTSRSMSKEERVAKTVVIIAAVFIVCFFPGCVAFMLYIALPGFTLYGVYGQLFVLMFNFTYLTEPINSGINLFIYYSMGTNFRMVVNEMFGIGKKS